MWWLQSFSWQMLALPAVDGIVHEIWSASCTTARMCCSASSFQTYHLWPHEMSFWPHGMGPGSLFLGNMLLPAGCD